MNTTTMSRPDLLAAVLAERFGPPPPPDEDPFIPVGPVRHHLLTLRRHMSYRTLSPLTGLHHTTLAYIAGRKSHTIRRDRAEAILTVPIPESPPVYEPGPPRRVRRRAPDGRCQRVQVHSYRRAWWDWAMVVQALHGLRTKDELNPTELAHVVWRLTRRGASDAEIARLLSWGDQETGGAVLRYRGSRGITTANPAFRPRVAPAGGVHQ